MRPFVTGTLLLAAALLFAAPPASALHPHVRDGWTVALGYGHAHGEVTVTPALEGEFENGTSPQIRVGHALGDHFAVGLSYAGWFFEEGTLPFKYRLSMNNLLGAVTWYPGSPERTLGGFYVRGGVGLAWTRITEVELVEGEEQGHGEHFQESGVGIELSLGYEFRVVPDVAFGLSVGGHVQDIGGDVFDRSSFSPVAVTAAWYW